MGIETLFIGLAVAGAVAGIGAGIAGAVSSSQEAEAKEKQARFETRKKKMLARRLIEEGQHNSQLQEVQEMQNLGKIDTSFHSSGIIGGDTYDSVYNLQKTLDENRIQEQETSIKENQKRLDMADDELNNQIEAIHDTARVEEATSVLGGFENAAEIGMNAAASI